MKLTKNTVILLASYLGMLALVCVTARLLIPVGNVRGTDGESAGRLEATGEVTDAVVGETDAVTVGRIPEGETAPETGASGDGDGAVTDAAGTETGTLYCVRAVSEDGGVPVIGIYDADGNLLRTLDTPIYALPSGDRAILESGLTLEGEDALSSLLEDLGG